MSTSTFMANKGNIQRKWYILDAAGKPLGKTAATAAVLLRGKHKPEYTPHADCGDYVIVLNAEKAVLTGKKLDQKYYRRHSGWVGGLKETKYRTLMQTRPEQAMMLAVRGMLPRNTLSRESMTRLKIYRGGEHKHAAQKPEPWVRDLGGVNDV
ncbi:MAG: 50S ribosomal protein L13 [Oscillospiraceae bacterium]|nr:50S ribosomal protein L13 [Oscillospiraceae bacterium]